jgi:hypothetical protein
MDLLQPINDPCDPYFRPSERRDLTGKLILVFQENMLAEATASGGNYYMDMDAPANLKQNIRQLKKEKAEVLTSSGDRAKVKRIRRKIKLFKRETRELAAQKKKLAAEATIKASTEKRAAAAAG